MKNKGFFAGIFSILLIFGLLVAGCGDGGGDSGGNTPGGGGTDTGPYVGIIGFNDSLNERNISLLTNSNKGQFQSFINSMRMKDGTGLYYAVDNGINRLQAAKLPDDVINVSIITFTDGLDNVSIELNTQYNSGEAYRDAVHNRISTVTIKNNPTFAYSIGIRGTDVIDGTAFRNGLTALASKPENVFEVDNMELVNDTFEKIAKDLNKTSQSQSIRLRMTAGYAEGTKIRFTFDNITDPGMSNFYIEGTYKRDSNPRLLENVVYQGLTSSSGTTVTGRMDGVFIFFTFENVSTTSGGSIPTSDTKQSTYVTSESKWQPNVEFGKAGDVVPIEEKKSAVIMLVLDCTTSLGDTKFASMKSAANGFIDILLGGTTPPTPSPYTVSFNANGGTGITPSNITTNAGSAITLPSGSGLSRSGYTFGGWNTNSSGTGTNYNAGASYTPTGSITLYAKWDSATANTYTVSFSANGGTGTTPSNITTNAGSAITLPSGSGLSRTGYTFGGWNTNASGNGTNYNAGASYTPTGSITLYAKWDSASSGTKTITLPKNQYDEGYQAREELVSLLNKGKITNGNTFTFTYSFRSNVAIDRLIVALVDESPSVSYWKELSSWVNIQSNIAANTVISGTRTITATGTATNAADVANRLIFDAGGGTASSPTLTFTSFNIKFTPSGIWDATANEWFEHSLRAGVTNNYRFYAQSRTDGGYWVSWNDSDANVPNSSQYTNIKVGVKREGSTSYIVNPTDGSIDQDTGARTLTFPSNFSGYVLIEVSGSNTSSSGNYEIGFGGW